MRQTTFGKVPVGRRFRFIREGAVYLKIEAGRYRLVTATGDSEYEAASTAVYLEVR